MSQLGEERPPSWLGMFLHQVGLDPDAPALITPEHTLSYGQLAGRASSAGRWIDGLELPPGAVVPTLVDDVGSALMLTIGGMCVGHPSALLGVRLTATELATIIVQLDSPVLVAEPKYRNLALEVASRAGVRLEMPPDFADAGVLPPPATPATVVVLHTSGTTGLPKRIDAPDVAVARRAEVLRGLFDLQAGDVCLVSAALHHVAGFGNVTLALGNGAAVATFSRFSTTAWESLRGAGVTHASTVPSMIVDLLAAGVLDAHPALRVLLYGGGPMRSDVLLETTEAIPDVALLQLFGQTEGTPITALTPEDHLQACRGRPGLLRSVGRAAPGSTVRLDDVDADGFGEVWVRGEHLFKTGDDGWLRTGDLGHIDHDGYLFLAGRKGDTINRGGENVRPDEVEDVLRQHPAVREVAVVGVPDRRLGQRVVAFIVRTDDTAELDETSLRAHTRAALAGFKVPESWFAIADLPRNTGGKVLRRVLAARAEL